MSNMYTKFECNKCSAITDFLEMNTKLDADGRSVLICPICESPDVVEYVNESEQMKKLRTELAAEREVSENLEQMYLKERAMVMGIRERLDGVYDGDITIMS